MYWFVKTRSIFSDGNRLFGTEIFVTSPVPKVLGGAAGHAFLHLAVGHVGMQDVWTLGPGQRKLEAFEEVCQTPGDDGVVVQGYVE